MHRSWFRPQKSLQMHNNIKNKIDLNCWKIEKNYQQWFDNFFGFVLLITTNKTASIKKFVKTLMWIFCRIRCLTENNIKNDVAFSVILSTMGEGLRLFKGLRLFRTLVMVKYLGMGKIKLGNILGNILGTDQAREEQDL